MKPCVPTEVLLQGVSWWERRYGDCPPADKPSSTADAHRWREAVDPDGAGLFDRRISWDGWAQSDVPWLLGPPAPGEPPTWWHDLECMSAACQEADPPRTPSSESVAFAEILEPLVTWSWDSLAAELDPAVVEPLAPPARESLRQVLLTALSQACAPSCVADFGADRPMGRTLLLKLGVTAGSLSSQRYLQWCRTELADGLDGLLSRHPALGRIIAVTAANWRTNTAVMLQRVATDREAISAAFDIAIDAPICAVRAGLSDPHRGGRTVAALGFGDPDTPRWIVYKPKDLRIERRYHDLVSSIGRLLPDGPCGLTVVAVGADYGYVAAVAHSPCLPHELPRFYRNAGRLLAILYFIGATDAHFENLIATDSTLHLIDAETLFQGSLTEYTESNRPPGESRSGPLAASVLRVGMLPGWLLAGPRNTPHDISALGVAPVTEPVAQPGWHSIGTDDIAWGVTLSSPSHPACLPVPAGRDNPLAAHGDAVTTGFSEVYRLVRDNRSEIRDRVLDFVGVSRRVVLRATRVYAETQRAALSADSLTTVNLRGFELERLSRSSLIAGQPSPYWEAFRAELHDMEQMDIPYFDHELGSDVVRSSLGPITGILASDGIAESIERIDSASDADMAWQVRLIRGAITARYRTVNSPPPTHGATAPIPPPADDRSVVNQVLDSLARSAVTDGHGHNTWLVLSIISESEAVQLGLIGGGLYDGRAGLAALLAVEPRPGPFTAHDVMAPVFESLSAPDPYTRFRFLRDFGLGWTGVGGLLRALEWLGSPTTSDEIGSVIEQLTVELVRRDQYLDLIGGVAGLVGPLARAYVSDPDPHRRELLRTAATHLTDRQGADGGWPSRLGPRPLTGLSHGASGMGLALLEAGVALGDDDVVSAGVLAFAYEAEVFDVSVGNWPDFREPTRHPTASGTGYPSVPGAGFMTAWCHGAPGIALARLRALELLPDHREAARWRVELDRALATTTNAPEPANDHLCCGLTGRAAVLRIAGRALGAPEWVTASDTLTDRVCTHYAQAGHFRLPLGDPTDPRLATPQLMSGSVGIALHLSTRLHDTDLRGLLVP